MSSVFSNGYNAPIVVELRGESLEDLEAQSRAVAEVVQVRYDSVANLVAAGIVPPAMRPGTPEPFPGFVPDPR